MSVRANNADAYFHVNPDVLRKAYRKLGLNRREAAAKCSMSYYTFRDIELGWRSYGVHASTFRLICEGLSIDPVELMEDGGA